MQVYPRGEHKESVWLSRCDGVEIARPVRCPDHRGCVGGQGRDTEGCCWREMRTA